MIIEYRDELGVVIEEIDEYGISFVDDTVYFNDKKVNVKALIAIREEVNTK